MRTTEYISDYKSDNVKKAALQMPLNEGIAGQARNDGNT
jgi:hypothetical protein